MVKILKNFPNYEIHKDGKILNIKLNYFLKPRSTGFGNYPSVQMFDASGKRKTKYVHILVAEAFIPNPENKPQVNHIDGDKKNFSVNNLEWVTCSENVRHAYDTKLHIKASGVESPNTNLTSGDVNLVCRLLMDGYRVKDVCEITGVPTYTVKNIKCGRIFKDIVNQYDLKSVRKVEKLSKETVIWVCRKIKEGLSNRQILKASTNSNLNMERIRSIRNRKSFTNITDTLDF